MVIFEVVGMVSAKEQVPIDDRNSTGVQDNINDGSVPFKSPSEP